MPYPASTNAVVNHYLASVRVVDKTHAEYTCACGAAGSATMAGHLASLSAVEKRAIKNHEMHQVRALLREKKSKMTRAQIAQAHRELNDTKRKPDFMDSRQELDESLSKRPTGTEMRNGVEWDIAANLPVYTKDYLEYRYPGLAHEMAD